MKNLRMALAVTVVAGFSVLAPSPAQAQSEPDPYAEVTVHVSESTVVGGNNITIEATVDPDVDCAWTLTFMGDTRTGSGTSITRTFDTPEVDETTEVEATASCTYNPTVTGSGTQTLLPEDDDGDGDGDGDDGGLLPNTGGERLAWLLIGALLILVGGGVVVASRRRDA